MKDLLDYIFNNNIPLTILVIIAIIIFIVETKKNTDTIKSICVSIYKFFKNKVFRLISNAKRKKYNKCVSTIEFLEWQKLVLKKLYKDVIEDYNSNEELNHSNDLVKCEFSNLFNNEYEAIYFRSNNELKAPFKELFNKEEVIYNDFDKKKLKEIKNNTKSYQRKYYRLVKTKIHYPYNIGYMLKDLNFHDNNSFHFKAETGVYLENVYTSNILEYELYKIYKNKKLRKNILEFNSNKMLELMPQRNSIHKNFMENNKLKTDILTSGKGRKSLLSVSMMVLCKNRNGSYDTLRIRRSENVDAKVGFLQFVPSGGFSALDAGLDFDSQFSNASLTKGLLREFLEECFGEEDYSGVVNHSPEDIYSNEIIRKIDFNNIYFLGTALSLVSLRHELCFLMVIDDEEIISKMKSNDESDNTLHFIDIKKLEKEEFWNRYSKNNNKDVLMLNATSASLLNLAFGSKIYKKLTKKEEQQTK